MRKRPKPPALPDGARHVWNAFAQLHAARQSAGFGPLPITFGEIAAYDALTGAALRPWEVEAVRALDDEYLNMAYSKGSGSNGG